MLQCDPATQRSLNGHLKVATRLQCGAHEHAGLDSVRPGRAVKVINNLIIYPGKKHIIKNVTLPNVMREENIELQNQELC